MWTENYNRYANILSESNAKQLHEQMERIEKDAPELFAAVNFLALSFADQIDKFDPNTERTSETVIRIIPKLAINFALRAPLVLPLREDLCKKLNAWATHVWFEKLRGGVLEEPSHFCDD
jgi:hypothetical protein